MKKLNIEEIEKLDFEELIEIIIKEPLLSGQVSINSYTIEQRKIIKNKVLEIARLTLDLAELELKFQKMNKDKILEILLSLL